MDLVLPTPGRVHTGTYLSMIANSLLRSTTGALSSVRLPVGSLNLMFSILYVLLEIYY